MLEAIQLFRQLRHVRTGWAQRSVVLIGKSTMDFESLQTTQGLVSEGVAGRGLSDVSDGICSVSGGADFDTGLGECSPGLSIGEATTDKTAGSDGTYLSVASGCCSGELSKSGGLIPRLGSSRLFNARGATGSKGASWKYSLLGRLGCRDINSSVWHVWFVKGLSAVFLNDVANGVSSMWTTSEKAREGETAGEDEALLWRNSDPISRNSPGIGRSTLGDARRGPFVPPELNPRDDAK